jgi:putative transposase
VAASSAFLLSCREVEEMMLERGVVVSHAYCAAKFGQIYANGLRHRQPRPGGKWQVDEVFIKIGGKTHYLWRAADQHGDVLDILSPPGGTLHLSMFGVVS